MLLTPLTISEVKKLIRGLRNTVAPGWRQNNCSNSQKNINIFAPLFTKLTNNSFAPDQSLGHQTHHQSQPLDSNVQPLVHYCNMLAQPGLQQIVKPPIQVNPGIQP